MTDTTTTDVTDDGGEAQQQPILVQGDTGENDVATGDDGTDPGVSDDEAEDPNSTDVLPVNGVQGGRLMTPKIGDLVFVTTSAGLRARIGPNAAVARKNGQPVLRARGFRFTIRSIQAAGGRDWAQAERYWYALAYLSKDQKHADITVTSPVPGYQPTTPWRKKPRDHTYWQARGYHTGTDWAAPTGTHEIAVRSGTVHHRWDNTLGHIALLYADNDATYWYCHTSQYTTPDGGLVTKGQTIALVGHTGTGARGPHLHLEHRQGHTSSWAGPDLNPLDGW